MTKINNTGGLWANKYKAMGDNKPDYIGEVTIGGITYKIAGWQQDGSGGRPLVNIKVTELMPVPVKAADVSQVKDEDLPF